MTRSVYLTWLAERLKPFSTQEWEELMNEYNKFGNIVQHTVATLKNKLYTLVNKKPTTNNTKKPTMTKTTVMLMWVTMIHIVPSGLLTTLMMEEFLRK
jgi:hypothetical protein